MRFVPAVKLRTTGKAHEADDECRGGGFRHGFGGDIQIAGIEGDGVEEISHRAPGGGLAEDGYLIASVDRVDQFSIEVQCPG